MKFFSCSKNTTQFFYRGHTETLCIRNSRVIDAVFQILPGAPTLLCRSVCGDDPAIAASLRGPCDRTPLELEGSVLRHKNQISSGSANSL